MCVIAVALSKSEEFLLKIRQLFTFLSTMTTTPSSRRRFVIFFDDDDTRDLKESILSEYLPESPAVHSRPSEQRQRKNAVRSRRFTPLTYSPINEFQKKDVRTECRAVRCRTASSGGRRCTVRDGTACCQGTNRSRRCRAAGRWAPVATADVLLGRG